MIGNVMAVVVPAANSKINCCVYPREVVATLIY